MKILILTDYYPPDKLGGVGQIAESLCDEYEKAGHETWVLTTGTQQAKQKRIIRSSPSLIKGVFLNNIKAIQLIRREGIDAINMHQSSTTLFLLTKHFPLLYKKFPKVVNAFQVSYFSEFAHIRSITVKGRTFKPLRKEYIEKWIFAPMHIMLDLVGFIFADEVTVVSQENRDEFERTYGRISRKTVKVIPNGINTDDFRPLATKPKIDINLAKKIEGRTVLLYAGVFRVRKRVFNLLFAIEAALKKNPDIVLVLVGGGGRGYEEDIKSLARNLSIEKNIIFTGRVPNEEVVQYLGAADVFCLASSYEGMPVAILEAMASGKPILTTNVVGMADLIEDGKDGFLTEVDDIDTTTKQILRLAKNKDEIADMSKAARQKIVDHYQWKAIAKQYLELF